jgi:hypothetical protein
LCRELESIGRRSGKRGQEALGNIGALMIISPIEFSDLSSSVSFLSVTVTMRSRNGFFFLPGAGM